jgi:phosphopentomutase
VIARPFAGTSGNYERTPDRHDYSVLPPHDTVLDAISHAGRDVRGVGKISDIFAGRGVTHSRTTRSNEEGIEGVIEQLGLIDRGLVFANLVDFDQSFGHRNDPAGYAGALEDFDRRLPDIVAALEDDDVLIITADHGNDPTTPSTDHSRERVPLLVTGRGVTPVDLGVRASFTDCGATVADLLGVEISTPGESFAPLLFA